MPQRVLQDTFRETEIRVLAFSSRSRRDDPPKRFPAQEQHRASKRPQVADQQSLDVTDPPPTRYNQYKFDISFYSPYQTFEHYQRLATKPPYDKQEGTLLGSLNSIFSEVFLNKDPRYQLRFQEPLKLELQNEAH